MGHDLRTTVRPKLPNDIRPTCCEALENYAGQLLEAASSSVRLSTLRAEA